MSDEECVKAVPVENIVEVEKTITIHGKKFTYEEARRIYEELKKEFEPFSITITSSKDGTEDDNSWGKKYPPYNPYPHYPWAIPTDWEKYYPSQPWTWISYISR